MTAYAMASPVAQPRSIRRAAPTTPGRAPRVRVEMIQTPAAKARRRTLLVVLLLAVAAFFAPQAIASDGDQPPAVLDTHTVAAGETLWSIAEGLAPAGIDVRDVVADLQTLNAMSDSTLQAGEQILLPTVG